MAYAFRNHYEYRKDNGRHDEDLDHVPEFKKKVDDIIDNSKTILFVGWRYDADISYDHFDYTTKFAKVTLIEAWAPNCEDFVKNNKWNHPVEVICADVLEFIKTTDRKFDTCVWFDGPEHVTYEEFIDFMRNAYGKFNNLIISTPNGNFPQGALSGNSFEIHKSAWFEYTYDNLGFETIKWLANIKDSTTKENALMGIKKMTYDENKTLKLYIYPHARIQSQDKINEFFNTTPMSIEGVNKHFKIVSDPKEADFLHMGMISCGTVNEFTKESFTYLESYPNKHIVDLEGDWVNNVAPDWVSERIKSGNSSKPEHLKGIMCIRPAISNLLAYLAKINPEYELEFPSENTFCFRGYPDPFGVRANMVDIMNKLQLPGEYNLTNKFNARRGLEEKESVDYCLLIHRNMISLCPRGAGIDSIRFYETCFFGRVPVCISDAKWTAEEMYDMSFAYRISPSSTNEEIANKLKQIHQTPHEELVDRGRKAREYFQKVIVEYFKDPTLYFLKYLKFKNVL